MAQEALANVAKHAGATRVGVTLSYMDDVVLLDVRDDGTGFDPDRRGGPASGGFGLTGDARSGSTASGRHPGRSSPSPATAPRSPPPSRPSRGLADGDGDSTGDPIRLLIVDDHPVVRDGLRGIFAGDPEFEVVGEAGDGAEAVAAAPGRSGRMWC